MGKRGLQFDDLYRIPFASEPQVTSAGDRVAFVVTVADEKGDENVSRVWVVPADGGTVRSFTAGPDDGSPRWSPDGRWLAFVGKRGGDKNQVWLIPSDGGEANAVTDLPGGTSSPRWSPDGRRLAVLSIVDVDAGEPADEEERGRRQVAPRVIGRLDYKADGTGLVASRRAHLFVVDLTPEGTAAGEARQLTDGDFSIAWPAWSPDSRSLAYSASTHADRDVNPGSSIFVVAADGSRPPRALTSPKGIAASPVWTTDGMSIAFGGRRDSSPGHVRLFTVPADGGEAVELAPGFDRNVMLGAPAYPGSPPLVTPGGDILFCARDRGCTHVYRVPLTGGEPEKVLGGDDRVASSLSLSKDGTRLAFLSASPRSPGEVHVAAGDGRGQRSLTTLVLDALSDVELLEPVPRTFTSPDGLEIHGWVLRDPSAATPGPLLLDVHGGPHNAWSPVLDGAHLYHQTLARAGWTILTINPRGSDGYGESFFTALTGAWGRADLHDFLAPIDVLVDDGLVDDARVAVCGYSYGGYMTCWLTAQSDRFAAAAAGGCLSDLTSFFGTSDLGFHLGSFEIGGLPWSERDRFVDLSPLSHVANVRTPTLVLHGEADDRCPVQQGEQWFSALRSIGCVTEFVRYPGASHLFIALGRPSHRIDYCRRIHDWVSEHASPADRG